MMNPVKLAPVAARRSLAAARLAAVLALTLGAAAGCKKAPAAGAAGGGGAAPAAPAHVFRCDGATAISECTEYNDTAMAAGGETWRQLCGAGGSSFAWAEGPCPSAGVSGSCVVGGRTIRRYSTGGNPTTTASAQETCTTMHQGTFRPGM